jgi:hypothetical protein
MASVISMHENRAGFNQNWNPNRRWGYQNKKALQSKGDAA